MPATGLGSGRHETRTYLLAPYNQQPPPPNMVTTLIRVAGTRRCRAITRLNWLAGTAAEFGGQQGKVGLGFPFPFPFYQAQVSGSVHHQREVFGLGRRHVVFSLPGQGCSLQDA